MTHFFRNYGLYIHRLMLVARRRGLSHAGSGPGAVATLLAPRLLSRFATLTPSGPWARDDTDGRASSFFRNYGLYIHRLMLVARRRGARPCGIRDRGPVATLLASRLLTELRSIATFGGIGPDILSF